MNFTNLKNFMDDMAAKHSPGNAVEVYLGGKLVFRYACGYADLETEQPLTGDEMFNIYSCSKLTTVTAGIQLLEQGRILLNDPLYDYISEFKEMYIKTEDGLVKAKNPIRIGDLFSMTAGFTYNLNSEGFRRAKELTGGKMDTVDVVRCMASDPLSFEPGTHWQYSLCHDVLAALVSVVSGKKFRDYVKENIFDPLGMTESVYHHTPKVLKRMASLYSFVPNGTSEYDIVEAQKYGNARNGAFKKVDKSLEFFVPGEEYDSGGAGITTTVAEYSQLMTALANYGKGLNGERILSSYSVNLMRTNRLNETQLTDFNWGQLAGCGYGLGVRTHMNPAISGSLTTLGEFGWGGAAGATAIIDPKLNLSVFYVQHVLNPREDYYQPRLKNVVYSCLDD